MLTKFTKNFEKGVFLVGEVSANSADILLYDNLSENAATFATLTSEEVDVLLMTLIELKAGMLGMKDLVKVADLLLEVGKAFGIDNSKIKDIRNQFLASSIEKEG